MNLIEAVAGSKGVRRIRRRQESPDSGWQAPTHFSVEDLKADDWEIEDQVVPLSKSKYMEARKIAGNDDEMMLKLLGIEE